MKHSNVWLFILVNLVFAHSLASTGDDNSDVMKADSLIYAWEIKDNFQNISSYSIDTNLQNIHVVDPIYANGRFFTALGNIGSPAKSLRFFDAREHTKFLFLDPLAAYLYLPENRAYFNTKRPFSNIKYTTNFSVKDKSSQQVSFFHTQNVNKKLNGGFDYSLISSEGQYAKQKNKIGNFSFFSSYTGKQYTSHTNLNLNNLDISQNGGVILDEFFNNIMDTKAYSTNLNDAQSKFRNRSVFTMHTFRFGASVKNGHASSSPDSIPADTLVVDHFQDSLSHDSISDSLVNTIKDTINKHPVYYRHNITYSFNYEDNFMRYSDLNPTTAEFFYDTIYGTKETYDSSSLSSFSNSLGYSYLVSPKSNVNIGALINNDIRRYSMLTHNKDDQPAENDTTTQPPDPDSILYDKSYQNNTDVSFYIDQNRNNYSWNIKANYYLLGYYANNHSLSGRWWNHIPLGKDSMGLTFSGKYMSRRPDYFMQNYLSNHVRWDNAFNDRKHMNIKLKLDNYSHQLSLAFDYALIHNHIYFDTAYTPQQYKKPANVYALSLYKKFAFWKIRSKNKVVLQQTDSENVIRMPLLCFYHSTYLQQTLNFESTGGTIDLQLGFDFYYHSAYKAYKYMPVINRFYLQDGVNYGNYPYFDVFLNLKVKRVRLFVKYSHANYYLMENRHFTAYSYPMNEPVFRFGVYWSFYN